MHAEHEAAAAGAGATVAQPEDPATVEDELAAAEADLDEREKQALADGATGGDLAALADERDGLAVRRDELAARYDARASTRDRSSLTRDVAGSARDVRARGRDRDEDDGFPDRFLAARDRDAAAADRAGAVDDRARSARDRERAAQHRDRATRDRSEAIARIIGLEERLTTLTEALGTRTVIGQAQGLLMSRFRVDAEGAFAMLVRMSQVTHTKLRDVAARLVLSAPRDDGDGRTGLGPAPGQRRQREPQ